MCLPFTLIHWQSLCEVSRLMRQSCEAPANCTYYQLASGGKNLQDYLRHSHFILRLLIAAPQLPEVLALVLPAPLSGQVREGSFGCNCLRRQRVKGWVDSPNDLFDGNHDATLSGCSKLTQRRKRGHRFVQSCKSFQAGNCLLPLQLPQNP